MQTPMRAHLREVALVPERIPSMNMRTNPSKERGRTTHLHVPVKVPHGTPLDLNALDPLALHLRGRLHRVPDGGLEDGEECAGADDGVGAEGHEDVREAVDADGEVRRRVRRPLRAQVDAVAAEDLEGELPGGVVACVDGRS